MLSPFFLSLLVLLTPLDDLWARGTPDRADDAMAAANNDILSRTADEGAALPPQPAACPVWPAPPAEAPRPSATRGGPPFGPDPLYLLTSLQR